MQDFKKLQVWQKSHDLTLRMDELTSLMDTIIEVRKMLTSLLRRLKTVNC